MIPLGEQNRLEAAPKRMCAYLWYSVAVIQGPALERRRTATPGSGGAHNVPWKLDRQALGAMAGGPDLPLGCFAWRRERDSDSLLVFLVVRGTLPPPRAHPWPQRPAKG